MVKCVLINEALGDIQEIETPLQKDLYMILKGPGTFVGQYGDIDVVVMKCRESPFELLINQNKLPHPLEDEVIQGPILLVRMNEFSEPEDFTLHEFETRYFV
jgi:hypothetical protein